MAIRTRAYFAGLATFTQTNMADLFDSVLMDQDISAFGRTLVDDADAATARATLGLGTAATQASSAFAAASHTHAASDIVSGSLDGDRLGAPTSTKRGGVKATGTPSGKFLRDDDTWASPAGSGDFMADGSVPATGDFDMDGNQVTGLGAPSSADDAATKDYVDTAVAGASGAPTGAMVMWPLNSNPTGWLECNGQSVSRATYAALFAVLGTTYGAVDGSHFNLPDFTSLFPRGASDPTTSPTGGADTHDHGAATGSNTTGITGGVVNNQTHMNGAVPTVGAQGVILNDPGHTHSIASGDNVPAYRKVRFIIKT